MPRHYGLIWTVLAGILFLTGLLPDNFLGKSSDLHLRLGSWETTGSGDAPTSVSFRLDSLYVSPFTADYELQVRQAAGDFNQQIHPGVLRPSRLVNAHSPEQMKIRKIEETSFRFRLQEFYPDFTFQYSYPANIDTIAPRAPGITLSVKTPAGDEVITLREDLAEMNKLDDVIELGTTLEFYWSFREDSFSNEVADTNNTIIFSGKENKIYFRFDGNRSSFPLELNRYYPMPGKDTVGFTVLQCFPDIAYLTAHPATRSDRMNNPVAAVEVWKLKSHSQVVYLYPASFGKPGGQWEVPGKDLFLALGLSHDMIVQNCKCAVSVADSINQFNKQIILKGEQHTVAGGKRMRLVECDPNGLWASIHVQNTRGSWMMLAGGIGLVLFAVVHFILRKNKNQVSTTQHAP